MTEGKLQKDNIETIMSLTSMQEGLLYYYNYNENSMDYHEQICIRLKGDLKIDLFYRAWQHVIESNEILRTVFWWQNIDKPIQVVLKKKPVTIHYMDLSSLDNKDEIIQRIKEEDGKRKIDITKETIRIYLNKVEDDTHEMIVSSHHILYDGWSNGIIYRELMTAYTSLYMGSELTYNKKPSFREFLRYLKNCDKEKEKAYWKNYLAEYDHSNDIFANRLERIPEEKLYTLDEEVKQALEKFAKEQNILVSTVFYCAWGLLMGNFNNMEEYVFGMVVSGRSGKIASIENMVGLFINTIPLKVCIDKKKSMVCILKQIEEDINNRKEYDNTPMVDIKNYCGLIQDEELFHSIVAVENYPIDSSLNETNVLALSNITSIENTQYNMALSVQMHDKLELHFKYNAATLNRELVSRMGGYLNNIIKSIISSPMAKADEIELMGQEETNYILNDFNRTFCAYNKNLTIDELFKFQVTGRANQTALLYKDISLTYGELCERADRLAAVLRSQGVKNNVIVGILLERSIEMIVAILGVIKAGGAYLPIDSNSPKQRIKYMLEDSKSRVLISRGKWLDEVDFDGITVNMSMESEFSAEKGGLERNSKPDDLLYVIYTSGTTGNPKAVTIQQKSLVSRFSWFHQTYPFDENDTILMQLNYAFDYSINEILFPLLAGAKIGLLGHEEEKDPVKVHEAIIKYHVTSTDFVPSLLDLYLGYLEENLIDLHSTCFKYVFAGGEELKANQVERFYNLFRGSERLINLYGPTEATIFVTHYECKRVHMVKRVPIGTPVGNVELYILNNGHPAPVMIPGELYISGEGLAKDYLNQAELTAEKFVDNPFHSKWRMYGTGDLARWLPDGNIEYLGRMDSQVKLRGARIELGEIESRILGHKEVKEAAVVVKKLKNKENYLCAYIVSSSSLADLNLKDFLMESMPSYMVPSYFIQLERLPVNFNGKLARKLLPEPDLAGNPVEYEAPQNINELKLQTIWKEVLQQDNIGIHDNFFELGGHSLKATTLIAKIRKEMQKSIPLKVIFSNPTIKGLGDYINSISNNPYADITPVRKAEFYETSPAQKRIYMMQQLEEDNTSYNIYAAFKIEGTIDIDLFEASLQKLMDHHGILRTSFDVYDGRIIQMFEDDIGFKVEVMESESEIDDIVRAFIRPFDLNKAPLFRIGIVKNKNKSYLLFNIHHIIFDGISMDTFLKDFNAVYNGMSLTPNKLDYKDFSAWHIKYLQSDEIKKQEQYWMKTFGDKIPVLELAYDFERPDILNLDGDSVRFEIEEDMYQRLKQLAKETESTLFIVLLSAFYILLHKNSKQEDIVVGTPVSGRLHSDIENIVGMFVNMLALRAKPKGALSFFDFLSSVKEIVLQGIDNQGVQFETLVDKLGIQRDAGRRPIFDVMFNLINNLTDSTILFKDFSLNNYPINSQQSKYDLSMDITEGEHGLHIDLEYSSYLFYEDTIYAMGEQYIKILDMVCSERNIILSDL